MRVETAVHKWTHTLPSVEVATWDLCYVVLVLCYQLVLVLPISDHFIGRNDHIAIPPADRASPKMMFAGSLIISGSPLSDAIKAERMTTILQNPELTTFSQNFLNTNTAFLVSLVVLFFLDF